MPDSILPAVFSGTLSGLPTQDPRLEGLPSDSSASETLKPSLLSAFEQSLQDSLETNRDPDQPAIACLLPLTAQTWEALSLPSPPTGWQPGKVLPQSAGSDGNGLPPGQHPNPSGAPAQPLTGLFNLIQHAGIQAAKQFDLSQAVQVGMSDGLETRTEVLQQTAEVRTAGTPVGHYPIIGSPADITASHPRAGGLPVLTVDVPVAQPDWDKALGERIQWMLGKQIQEAEVKLNPPHLGPLEVRVSLHQDQANVSFLASQAPTREALEAALPRLREMFGEANLNLIDVNVGQRDSSGQQSAQSGAIPGYVGIEGTGPGETTATPGPVTLRLAGSSMFDDYA